MKKELWDFKHFKSTEFDSPDKRESGLNMNHEFMLKLDRVRHYVNRPFSISSGYRTKAHNLHLQASGYRASDNSSHMKGLACDILALDSEFRYAVVEQAILAGFTRIGIATDFIHLDLDKSKIQEVIWVY